MDDTSYFTSDDPHEHVKYSNTSVVRDLEGTHAIFVGEEKMIGVTSISMQPNQDGPTSLWVIVIPSSRVRLCERIPAPILYEQENVVSLPSLPSGSPPNTTPKSAA
jgi:hypothetical protein